MRNRIRKLEDLHREKKLLQLEIKVTEQLMMQSLQDSKEHLFEGVTDSLFALLRHEPIGSEDLMGIFSGSDERDKRWWQKLMPYVPLILKVAGIFYEKKKSKKTANPRRGEVVLHRAAS